MPSHRRDFRDFAAEQHPVIGEFIFAQRRRIFTEGRALERSTVHRVNPREVELFQPIDYVSNGKLVRKNTGAAIEISMGTERSSVTTGG